MNVPITNQSTENLSRSIKKKVLKPIPITNPKTNSSEEPRFLEKHKYKLLTAALIVGITGLIYAASSATTIIKTGDIITVIMIPIIPIFDPIFIEAPLPSLKFY